MASRCATIDDAHADVLCARRRPQFAWLDALAESRLGHKPIISHGELTGSGKAKLTFDQVAIDKATEYAAEDADVTLRLWSVLKPRLAAEHMTTVYETLERPLVAGAGADGEARHLGRPADAVAAVRRVRADGGAAGGRDPGARRRAVQCRLARSSSATSCSARWACPAAPRPRPAPGRRGAEVLEELAEQGHELPRKILDWRQVSKLKSHLYRCAADLHQSARPSASTPPTRWPATTTGRLSSTEPNLQNIPVRTEEGRKHPHAPSSPPPGTSWSRPTIRRSNCALLAHIADIPALKQAFEDGIDIHAMTASEMFGVPVEGHAERSAPPRQGDQFRHHLRHLGVRAAPTSSASRARRPAPTSRNISSAFPASATTWTRPARLLPRPTAMSRRCSAANAITRTSTLSNPSVRAFNERAAINAPMQGTAADIIRRAMIRMDAGAGRGEALGADAAAGA